MFNQSQSYPSKFLSSAAWSELLLHIENLFFFFLAPFIVQIALIVGLVLVARHYLPASRELVLPFSLMFGVAGIVLGYFVGASRQPVVAALVPAILVLVGGLSAYAFGKDSVAELRAPTGFALGALMLGALSGTVHGQSVRTLALHAEELQAQQREHQREISQREYDAWKLHHEKVELPLRLQMLRRQLGLPLEASGSAARNP